MPLHFIDYAIMLIYVGFVVGIGFALSRYMKTGADFFLSGRSIPAWVCGLACVRYGDKTKDVTLQPSASVEVTAAQF